MKITFDLDKNEVTIESKGQNGTEYVPGLNERLEAIIEAAGMEMISGNELADDIDALMEDLGLNVRAAREQ